MANKITWNKPAQQVRRIPRRKLHTCWTQYLDGTRNTQKIFYEPKSQPMSFARTFGNRTEDNCYNTTSLPPHTCIGCCKACASCPSSNLCGDTAGIGMPSCVHLCRPFSMHQQQRRRRNKWSKAATIPSLKHTSVGPFRNFIETFSHILCCQK